MYIFVQTFCLTYFHKRIPDYGIYEPKYVACNLAIDFAK